MKNAYYFGDKALSGLARQQINKDGELCYKGVIHLFGSKVPIFLSVEPCDKYVKGEKLFKVFTYLTPIPAERKGSKLQVQLRTVSTQRLKAIKHVEKLVQKLGVIYEYENINKEKKDKLKCKSCKAELNKEWKARLQDAVRSNVARQKEICRRKVQRLLAYRKRNKRNNH
jgi:hypothetical protein